jgi:hypothetical protein
LEDVEEHDVLVKEKIRRFPFVTLVSHTGQTIFFLGGECGLLRSLLVALFDVFGFVLSTSFLMVLVVS